MARKSERKNTTEMIEKVKAEVKSEWEDDGDGQENCVVMEGFFLWYGGRKRKIVAKTNSTVAQWKREGMYTNKDVPTDIRALRRKQFIVEGFFFYPFLLTKCHICC